MQKTLAIFFFFISSLTYVHGADFVHGATQPAAHYTHDFFAAHPIAELHAPLVTAIVTAEEENRSEEEFYGNVPEDLQNQIIHYLGQVTLPFSKLDSSSKKLLRLFALYHCWRAEL
jgi:hypothetical protein